MASAVFVFGGDGLVSGLLTLLIYGIILGLIFWTGNWFIKRLDAPPMWITIWMGLFILIALIVAINFLLGLGGHSFIKF